MVEGNYSAPLWAWVIVLLLYYSKNCIEFRISVLHSSFSDGVQNGNPIPHWKNIETYFLTDGKSSNSISLISCYCFFWIMQGINAETLTNVYPSCLTHRASEDIHFSCYLTHPQTFSKNSLHLSEEKRIFAKKRNDANNIYIFRIQIHVLF